MTELTLNRDERLRLRAQAHHLNPVVLLGAAGLTEAVIKETDRALAAHELIKVRLPGDDRDEREAICAQLADRLGAARVQVIGKLLVLYRPRPAEEAPARPPGAARPPSSARPRPLPAKGRPVANAPRAVPRRGSGRGR
ncbi:MAG: ribosome assembly RNA-binding protein YhbY [Burkholderiales bacterium]|jgi:putative YhbY family RNA-binding protein|nr:ribosome assembly RNA-binding protein YhbY [Burkholderiales bacterium]